MIRDRRLGSLTTKRPPDRGGDAYAATAADGAEQVTSSGIAPVTIARRLVWRGGRLPVALRIVPWLHRQRMLRHSIPIALVAGGAV
jgi:hypothetical protein